MTVFLIQQVNCRYYSSTHSAPASIGAPPTQDNGILSIINGYKRGLAFHIKNETPWIANGSIMQFKCVDPRLISVNSAKYNLMREAIYSQEMLENFCWTIQDYNSEGDNFHSHFHENLGSHILETGLYTSTI